MSTAARKARKRAGEKFVRVPKEGTPVALRRRPVIVGAWSRRWGLKARGRS